MSTGLFVVLLCVAMTRVSMLESATAPMGVTMAIKMMVTMGNIIAVRNDGYKGGTMMVTIGNIIAVRNDGYKCWLLW